MLVVFLEEKARRVSVTNGPQILAVHLVRLAIQFLPCGARERQCFYAGSASWIGPLMRQGSALPDFVSNRCSVGLRLLPPILCISISILKMMFIDIRYTIR